MDFKRFAAAVEKQFDKMAKTGQLFTVEMDKDHMWDTYLGAFPEGSNPIYRTNTEHHCSCCRQFIKTVGNVVAIDENYSFMSIWDIPVLGGDEAPYDTVAARMSVLVHNQDIDGVFVHDTTKVGQETSFEDVLGNVRRYNHFHVTLPPTFVMKRLDIATYRGEQAMMAATFMRGLTTIRRDAVEQVLELINQNSLYRGEEHKQKLVVFIKARDDFHNLGMQEGKAYVWKNRNPFLAGLRNSSIGTLLVALSEDEELDRAVAAYEAMVAPSNYKRPKPVVTKRMLEDAKKTLEAEGLVEALERRHAVVTDFDINNLLFADRTSRVRLTGSVLDDLILDQNKKANVKLDKIETVPLAKFISDVLPTARTLEILFDSSQVGNLVTLVAPAHASAPRLFTWDNALSWSYTGNVADSIKERVKRAGGAVEGDLCNRLSWFNYDDLDLHFDGPNVHISFSNKRIACGFLDVDMNAGSGRTREPVENIVIPNLKLLKPGAHRLLVHQFSQRENIDYGFEVEVDLLGQVTTFKYDAVVKGSVVVAEFLVDAKHNVTMVPKLPSGASRSAERWGISTNMFHPVSMVMWSPNHWTDQIGNKHLFFMIDGCKSDEQARGIYNEFLRGDLNKHRRVMELLGSKTTLAAAEDQLSGLGFSTTVRNEVVLRVGGNITRTIKVTI